MIVRFDSRAGGFTMFGEIAVTLLKMMGHSGVVPGAILAQDIPAALERLHAAVAAAPEAVPDPVAPGNRRDEREPVVSIRQRAFPLIELLERAAEKDADVLWDKG